MRAYHDLTPQGQTRRLHRLAQAALVNYDLPQTRLKLLSVTEHTVFRVKTLPHPAGSPEQFVLRIYQPEAFEAEAVAIELAWLLALRRETSLGVPEPIPAKDGSFLGQIAVEGVPESRRYALFRWVEGRRHQKLTPADLERVGHFLGRLHCHAEQFVPPEGLIGQHWDWEQVFGNDSVVGPTSQSQLLTAEQRRLFSTTAERLRTVMTQLGTAPNVWGLIHADFHSANYLFHRGELQAIDFEDCGWGYYLYDLAVVIDELEAHFPGVAPGLRLALLHGYSHVRALSDEHIALLDLFVAMRLAELVRWYGSSAAPALRAIAEKVLGEAEQWMRRLGF